MVLPMKRRFVVAFFAGAIAFTQTGFAASDWEIIKVSGHDYLSVENISKFYGLPAGVASAGDKIRFETVKNPLEFVSGSREAMINGARSWLCFPVMEHDGKYLVSRTDVAKTIEPLVRPQRVSDMGRIETVVLDPGHGGYDKGQMSRLGYEKDFALDVARKLRPLLHRSRTRRAIRFSSVFISMERMTTRMPPGLKFSRSRRAERHPLRTARSVRMLSTCNRAVRSMRKAQRFRLVFIIHSSDTSPNTTVASSVRGSLFCV
jgi:N-acetylmuramoyl-L-alanine amidase